MKTDITQYIPEAALAIVAIVALVTGHADIAFIAIFAMWMIHNP